MVSFGKLCFGPGQQGVILSSRGHLSVSGDRFGLGRGSVCWHLVGGDQGHCKHPARHRAIPHYKELSGRKYQLCEVEKSWLGVCFLFFLETGVLWAQEKWKMKVLSLTTTYSVECGGTRWAGNVLFSDTTLAFPIAFCHLHVVVTWPNDPSWV